MAEISDVRQAFYDRLKTFADAQSPALRIKIKGKPFTPVDNETYLEFHFVNGRPSKPYAGHGWHSTQIGFCQVNVIVPEQRLQKKAEQIAWDVAEAFWPSSASAAPSLGSSPLVRLGPTAPWVKDLTIESAPTVDAGKPGYLGSLVSMDWHSDFPKT